MGEELDSVSSETKRPAEAGDDLVFRSVLHRITSELTGVQALIEVTAGKVEDVSRVRSSLQDIHMHLDRLIRSMSDLQRLARPTGRSAAGPVSVEAVVKDASDKFAYKTDVAIIVKVSGSLPAAKADAQMLGEVLKILLTNSIKATTGRPKPTIRIAVRPVDDRLAIDVKDNGTGIPGRVAENIFRRPITDIERERGGYGLFLARRLVDSWDGTMEVINTGARGTTMRILLRKWEGARGRPLTRRALIVEDDVVWQDLIERAIVSRGLEVDTASSVESAQQLLANHGYDLVILDLRLGDPLDLEDDSALTIIRAVRERSPEAIVALMSAYAEAEDVGRALAEGADAFLAKIRFSMAELNKLIDKALARRETERESVRQSELNKIMYEILSMMSHELRAPLVTILRNAESLAVGALGPLARKQVEAVETVRSAVQRELTLVNGHLDLNRIERGVARLEYRECDLGALVREEVDAHRAEARRSGVKLRLHAPKREAPVKIDVNLFRVALNPLMDNAVKFSPEGEQVLISVQLGAEHVEVRISDRGPGIQPAELERLLKLQPEGLSQRLRGSGLGLSMAKRVIELNGGTLWVGKPKTRGTTVSFRIPIAK